MGFNSRFKGLSEWERIVIPIERLAIVAKEKFCLRHPLQKLCRPVLNHTYCMNLSYCCCCCCYQCWWWWR